MKGSTIYENEKVLFGICVAEVLWEEGLSAFSDLSSVDFGDFLLLFLACTLGKLYSGIS